MKPEQIPQSDIHLDDHQHDHDPHLKEISQNELKHFRLQGYISVFGGFCLHLVLGTFYLWGGISPYAAAYLRQYDSNVNLTLMSLIFPIMGLAMMSVLSFGVKLAERFGFKLVIFISGTIISIAFVIISYVQSFALFALLYCFMIGIPSGLVYMLPIICGWKFFPNFKARVSGPIIAGYGLGAFIFNFVCQNYVNPDNKHPTVVGSSGEKYFDEDVYSKVPNMFRILAGSYFGLTIIATFLIKYSRNIHPEPKILESPINSNRLQTIPQEEKECQTFKQGILSKPFFLLFPMIILSTMFGMLMANCYKIYGLFLGLDDLMLTITGSIASVTNGCSRAGWAFLMDKYGFKKIFLIITVLNLICSALIGYTQGNSIAYLILLAVTMGCEGGLFACFPAIAGIVFGHKVGPIIYGVLFFGTGLSNMIAYLLMKFTLADIHYIGLFWIMFGVNVASLILGIMFNQKHNWST